MNSRIEQIRAKKKKQQTYRLISIGCIALIVIILAIIFWPKAPAPEQTVPDPSDAPIETMIPTEEYTEAILGNWATKEGYYTEYKKNGTMLAGMSRSNLAKNKYTLNGNQITYTFTEGDSATATISIEKGEKEADDILIVKFENSTLKFNRYK